MGTNGGKSAGEPAATRNVVGKLIRECGQVRVFEAPEKTKAPAETLDRYRQVLRTAQAAENRRSWRRKWANRLALEIAWRYLQALERGETGAAPKEVLTPDVGLEEFPNLLTPLGKKCDLATALEGAERGEKVMSRQMFKIKQEIADHDRIAVEVEWVGTFAGTPWIHSGWRQMKAFFAVFLEFQEGKIIK